MRLGVGRRIDPAEVTATARRQALVDLVDDPAVAVRLAELRQELASGGTSLAADLIEAQLSRK
ncbi:hypothetical protein GCM10022247_53970 [Allokutzneria multivorans]|uniref:Uncharacterized protein n=1 Tax=Allokutzneria multivorans TaxID=1142134 RepID=A0ABP7T987_9PSEU